MIKKKFIYILWAIYVAAWPAPARQQKSPNQKNGPEGGVRTQHKGIRVERTNQQATSIFVLGPVVYYI